MSTHDHDDPFAHWLSRATGLRFEPQAARAVHGGSIHRCERWSGRDGDAFVKRAGRDRLAALEAEAESLQTLAAAGALRVPAVLAVGDTGHEAVLVLEWLELVARGDASVERALGERLAELHRTTSAQFGWHRDNTIGATPQTNEWDADWPRFYATRRLAPQLDLAAARGFDRQALERGHELCTRVGEFFTDYRPVPSLLHGDLWGGNWAVLAGSREPVVFDPAVYHGDREADLAMTRLFGGFGSAFYAAYRAAWPPDPGADARRPLYDLYHVLNHDHLFGGGYGRQAAALIERLLAELD
jgi:fructosamine-3-kinase